MSQPFLLIDNSNTRTKFAVGNATTLHGKVLRTPTRSLSAETILDITKQLEDDHGTLAGTLLCSVVPHKAEIIAATLSRPDRPFHRLSYRSQLDISIDYPRPEQIGADRLANSLAAASMYDTPAIVIDFGTAVTFDIVTKNTQGGISYAGGVIAPGLSAMSDYFVEKTALLPALDLHEPDTAIGKSTEDAMTIGAVHGYRGLVREIITEISKELPSKPYIICTGGDGATIAAGLDLIDDYNPTLTLEGIRLTALKNL